jgi:hypothetical protein
VSGTGELQRLACRTATHAMNAVLFSPQLGLSREWAVVLLADTGLVRRWRPLLQRKSCRHWSCRRMTAAATVYKGFTRQTALLLLLLVQVARYQHIRRCLGVWAQPRAPAKPSPGPQDHQQPPATGWCLCSEHVVRSIAFSSRLHQLSWVRLASVCW